MRSLVADGIKSAPTPALSQEFKEAIRRGVVPPQSEDIVVRDERHLAEVLSRFVAHVDSKPFLLANAEQAALAKRATHRALEAVMVAHCHLGAERQLLPVTVSWPAVAAANEPTDAILAEVATAIERDGSREILDRLESTSEGSPDLIADLRRFIRQPRDLETLSAAFERLGLPPQRARRDLEVIWRGLHLRYGQAGHDPSPWVIDEIHRETSQLAAVMEAHHRDAEARIHLMERAIGGIFAAAVGAVIGGALLPFVNPLAAVGLGLTSGALVALARRRAQPNLDDEEAFEPRPRTRPPGPMTNAPEPIVVRSALGDYVETLNTAGLIPVLMWENLPETATALSDAFGELAAAQSLLPRGLATVVLSKSSGASGASAVFDRIFVMEPSFSELHRYVRQRVPPSSGLSSPVKAIHEIERTMFTLAILHAAQSDLSRVESMLSERRIGAASLTDLGPTERLALRVRAAQQLGVEVILRESRVEMATDPIFTRALPVALGLLLRQWEQETPPAISDALLASQLHQYLPETPWAALTPDTQMRLRTAVSKLLAVFESRAWLVSVLPDELSHQADLIPEWPLVTRADGILVWTFRSDGRPRFDPEQMNRAVRSETISSARAPEPVVPSVDRSSRLRALLERSMAPEPMIETDAPAPMQETETDYLGDFTPALNHPASRSQPFIDPTPSDGDISMAPRSMEERDEDAATWQTAVSAMQLLESLDEALGELSERSLSVNSLMRCGLLPQIPTSETLRLALKDEASPESQFALAEVAHRVRERIGVIEKVLLWVTALQSLSYADHDLSALLSTLVSGRELRGRTAAEQNARLPSRVLKGELRQLCPGTRGVSKAFSRTGLPSTEPEDIVRWGDDLQQRIELLTYAMREGVTESSMNDAAWEQFQGRVRARLVDEDVVLSGLAEMAVWLDGRGPARMTSWLAGHPSCRQLSRLVLATADDGPADAIATIRASCALALGLNLDGLAEQDGDLLNRIAPELREMLSDAGPVRRPFVCAHGAADWHPVLDGPIPKSGSFFVAETPYDLESLGVEPDAYFSQEEQTFDAEVHRPNLSLTAAHRAHEVVEWVRRFIGAAAG